VWITLALAAMAGTAFAQAPGETPTTPPAPEPPVSPPTRGTDDIIDEPPRIDPAYAGRPDPLIPRDRAVGDDSYVRGDRVGREIVVRYYPDRSRNNITMLAVAAGTSVLFGAVGLYYHLDARSAASDFTAKPSCTLGSMGYECVPTVLWTPERQAAYERADRSASISGVSYGIGAALIVATAIAFIATEPAMQTKTIHPHTNRDPKPQAMIAPTRGGAFVGRTWSF
jgi:hypothetical protein